MLTNPYLCRQLTPLLSDADNPTDSQIRDNIIDIDGKIGIWLSGRYKETIEPVSYRAGTITVNKDSAIISGSSTAFTNLKPGDVIQVVSTGEALQVQEISGNTSFIASSNALYDSTDSYYWVIPKALATASRWLSTHLTIMLYYPEKTIKQDNIEKFDRRLEYFAGDIIKCLKDGAFQDTTLQPQASDKSLARLIYINTDADAMERTGNNLETILSNDFH